MQIGELDTAVRALTDPYSNVEPRDMRLLRRAYPQTRIQPLMESVSGIKTKTYGAAVVPMRFDCTQNSTPTRVQTDTEFHLVDIFLPELILGLDFLCDYRVELDIGGKTASFPTGHTTKLASLPSSQLAEVKVLSLNRKTIVGRTFQLITIWDPRIADNTNYTFLPFMTVENGMVPSPQLMHAVIDTGTRSMMFSNWSEHPVTIGKDHQLGVAEPGLFGCKVHRTGSHINWNDLVDPQATVRANGGITAVAGEQECFHVELQPSDSRVAPRKPGSIPDSESSIISSATPQRITGELLPPEDEDDNLLPETSPFTQRTPLISPHLSDTQ
jgi:hypothetical protein